VLELKNQSDWPAGLFPGYNSERERQLTVVFKVSYRFDEQGKLTPDNEIAIVEADEFIGDPLTTSLKAASEIAPFKQGGELYLHGSVKPERAGLTAMEVGIGILFNDKKQWKKVLRVFGVRKWKKTMVNYIHDEPGLVEAIPLSYEYAFGGKHPDDVDDVFAANPVGLGYNSDQRKLLSDELPRIELGPDFMMTPMQKPTPAGFGPLPPIWEPRVSDIGPLVGDAIAQGGCSHTKAAKKSGHNVAPYDQRFKTPFQGGEVLHLRALATDIRHQQTLQIVLPSLRPELTAIMNNEAQTLLPVCDTLVINSDEKTLSMIFRAGIVNRDIDRRKGWVVLNDLDFVNTPHKEDRDVPGMAS